MSVLGTIYVLHFDAPGLESRPGSFARHYVGWTTNLEQRLAEHRAGKGSPLVAAIQRAGLGWHVARTWELVDRHFERAIKERNETPRFCPVCVRERADGRGLLDVSEAARLRAAERAMTRAALAAEF